MDKILILGMGGHASSVADVLEREGKYEIIGYVVNQPHESNVETNLSYPIIGCDKELKMLYNRGIHFAAIGIGFLGKGELRNQLWRELKCIGFSLPIICDPSATISAHVELGEGCFVGKKAVINVNSRIGKMGIINTAAVVEHDCQIGDFSHISVGSILCGGVKVGKNVFIGAGSVVIQQIIISDKCIIAAGSTLRKNMEKDSMFINNKIVKLNRGGGK